MQEKLLAKVQALLNKAGCPSVSPEESQAFFAKAMDLLAKNGLETADLERVQKADGTTDFGLLHERADTGRKQHEADDYIWPILNRAFGVKTLYSTIGGNFAWLIVGDKLQVELATLASQVLYKTMTRNCRQYIKEHGLKKTARVKRSYFTGVRDGYLQKLAEAEAAAYAEATAGQRDAYGLVLVDKKAAIQAYVDEKLAPRQLKATKVQVDYKAYANGVETGRNLDLNSKNKLG